MNRNLLILGAGGHGRVVKETAESMKIFDKIDFLDDNSELAIGKMLDYKKYVNNYTFAFVGVGNNEVRINLLKHLVDAGFQIPIIIHPTAFISTSSQIEEGAIVCANAVINSNSKIKKGVIISVGAIIDHDSLVCEGSHINVGAIVKSNSIVDELFKVDAGIVYR